MVFTPMSEHFTDMLKADHVAELPDSMETTEPCGLETDMMVLSNSNTLMSSFFHSL